MKNFSAAKQIIQNILKIIKTIGYILLLFLEKLFYPFEKQKLWLFNYNSFKNFISAIFNFKLKKRNISKKTKNTVKEVWVPGFLPTKKIKKSKVRTLLFGCFMFFFGILLCIFLLLIPSHIYLWLKDLPNPNLLMIRRETPPTKIMDRKGRLLYEIYSDVKFEPIKLNAIPKNLINATIAAEDDEFFTHSGVNIKSTLRALKSIILDNNLQGGSTITQQLVKNALLSPDRTVSRKIKELVLALIVDAKYTKTQILEMYFNNISYGGNVWGVKTAAQKYFGKEVADLTLAECALLAGLPSSPSIYSPLTNDLESAKSRQKYVLDRMYKLNYITNKEAVLAYDEKLNFVTQEEYIRAPHFVDYVRSELERLYSRRLVEQGGLLVTTSLDLDIQDNLQKIIKEEVEKSGNLQITNGAGIVMSSKDAQILGMVGSIDYFIPKWGSYNVATGYRQPGSSIKPLTYALALSQKYTPASIIKDSPVTFSIAGQQAYTPKNYDGKYHGNVTLRSALANSYNIPAVRVASKLGPDNIVSLGKQMGLSNWEVDGSYGLSITLGGKEVRLVDLTNLYATFARSGKYVPISPFLSIIDQKGFEIYKKPESEIKQVLSPEVSFLIWHILSDNKARTPAFGVNNSLFIKDKTIAVKTGTTDLIRDNYTLGFTPTYTVGVWVGNNDNTPLNKSLASGLSGAAPIWNRIMSFLLVDKPDEKMEKPENVIFFNDKNCEMSEYFIKNSSIPNHLCDLEKKEETKDKKAKD